MERLNKEFWPLFQNRSSSAPTHLMNHCAPTAHVSNIYGRIWLSVRNRFRKVFAHGKFLSGMFWFLCLCLGATSDLIFVTNISNYILGEKIVMVKNFSFPCMTIVGKFLHMWRNFSTIDGVLLQFMPFCY